MKRVANYRKLLTLLMVCLVVMGLYLWTRKLSVRKYFEQNSVPFEAIAEYFCEQPPSRGVLVIERADVHTGLQDVDVTLPDEIQIAVKDVFSRSNCTYIYVSGHLDFCEFGYSDGEIKHSMVYLPTTESVSYALQGHVVRQKDFLSEHWMYFEAVLNDGT